jgi:chemotaxis protein histidine kinase CheA/methyl-accepting chemotaxis protein
MRLQTKLTAVSALILLLDAVCHISIGAYVITTILYNLNRNILAGELHTRVTKISEAYKILKDTGLESTATYVAAAQKSVFDDLKTYHYGASGGVMIYGADKKVVEGLVEDGKDHDVSDSEAAYIDEMISKKIGSIEFKQNGKSQYAAFETFEPWNWTVVLSISTDEMLARRSSYLKRVSLVAIFILLLNTFMLRGFGRRLTTKVDVSLAALRKVEAGDLSARIPSVVNDDEIGALQTEINSMISVIQVRNEELAKARDNLELRVQERSRELKEQLRNSSNLLNNMKQVVFAVNQTGTIVPPVSKSAETVFGTAIEGGNVFDVVFKKMDQKSEAFGAVNTAFIAVFGENSVQWELMEESFPKLLTFRAAGTERTLKLSYSPMWNDHAVLEKIMFVIEDITSVIELEKNIAAAKAVTIKNMTMIQELGANDPEELESFFSSSFTLLSGAKKKVTEGDADAFSTCMRNVHTLKGNARIFGLNRISSTAHEAEALMQDLGPSMVVIARDILADAQGSVFEYADLARRIYRSANGFYDKIMSEVHSVAVQVDRSVSAICIGDAKPELKKNLEKALVELGIAAKSIKSDEIARLTEAAKLMASKDGVNWKEFAEHWKGLAGVVRSALSGSALFHEGWTDVEIWVATFLRIEACAHLNKTKKHSECSAALSELAAHCATHRLSYLENLCDWIAQGSCSQETREKGIRAAWSYAKFVSMIQSSQVLDRGAASSAVEAIESDRSDDRTLSDLIFGKVLKVLRGRPGGIRAFFESTETRARDWIASDQQIEPLKKIMSVLVGGGDTSQIMRALEDGTSEADVSDVTTALRMLLADGEGSLVMLPYLRTVSAVQVLNQSFAQGGTSVTTRSRLLEVTEKNFNKFRQSLLEIKNDISDQRLEKLFAEFDRLADVPVKPSIQRMAPMVRDVSTRLGKSVDFKVMGGEPVLDRGKLSLLNDAMVHIIRNAIDHGIESPAERQQKGKGEEGTIAIECAESDHEVILRIWDDGKGINPDELAQVAVKKGLIDKALVQNLTDDQKRNLIFLEGFSTKPTVTEISGRGIGMSVVKGNIESLGGTVEVRSRPGQGTEVLIRLKSSPVAAELAAAA